MKFDEFEVQVGDCILVCKKIVVMMYVIDYLIGIRVRELILRLRCKPLSEGANLCLSAQIPMQGRKSLYKSANLCLRAQIPV